MIEKMNTHYSMTNPASVYDEEALTSLELVGRTTAKVNEVVESQNTVEATLREHNKEIESIPEKIECEVQHFIDSGKFDRAIDMYVDGLEARVDNLVGNTTTGTTTLDAEVIDARLDKYGNVHSCVGAHIRKIEDLFVIPGNDNILTEEVWANLHLDNYLETAGWDTPNKNHWCSDYIRVDGNTNYVWSVIGTLEPIYFSVVVFFNSNKTKIDHLTNVSTFKTPPECFYIRIDRRYFGVNGGDGEPANITSENYLTDDVIINKSQLQKGTVPKPAESKRLESDVVVNEENLNPSLKNKITGGFWYKGKKLLVYGDSITAMETWQSHVSENLELHTLWKGGVGGSTVANNNQKTTLPDGSEINAWMCGDDRINVLKATYVPDMVILFGGHNDFGNHIPIGEVGDTLVDSNFKSAYAMMIKKVYETYPNIPILALTPINGRLNVAGTTQDVQMKNKLGLTMTDYANAVKDVCQLYSIPCIDLNAETGINVLNANKYLIDVIHLNTEGGKKVANAIINGLKRFEPITF